MADLDIAERRRPQDGRIRVRLADRELNVRVSTVPRQLGESVVLRVLDRGGRPVGLDTLGMPASILEQVQDRSPKSRTAWYWSRARPVRVRRRPSTRPLRLRDAAAEKIITIEDPIEYQLPGITQVPVHQPSRRDVREPHSVRYCDRIRT